IDAQARAFLFAPAPAMRVRANQNRDTPLPPEEPAGENPPTGAVIDYWLARDASGPVRIEILDARGEVVRRVASDDARPDLRADRYFAQSWIRPPEPLSAQAGAHRYVWDLHYER